MPKKLRRPKRPHQVRATCTQPDRDEPRITCGYPLPCPHHTAVIDLVAGRVTFPAALTVVAARHVVEIADALGEEESHGH